MSENLNEILGTNAANLSLSQSEFDAVESSNYPTYILTRDGDFVYANDAFSKYTDNPKSKIMTLNTDRIRDTFEPSIREVVLRRQREASVFQQIVGAHKHKRSQLAIGKPITDENGEITHILVILAPVTMMQDSIKDGGEGQVSGVDSPIARSAAMQRILRLAKKAAVADCPCLISGDTGVGKGIVAQYIHKCSPRSEKPLVTINCAAMQDTLIESELFGYEPGSFTGASRNGKKGAVELANGGTLFLDEINSLSPAAQGKLLRVLETRKLRRVGAEKEIDVDFRLIVASNASLLELCDEGLFRRDLYYRINLLHLIIPPLRDRKEDIFPMANAFLREVRKKYGYQKIFSPTFCEFLIEHDWPGNVRELQNCIEQSYLMSDEGEIMLRVPEVYSYRGSYRGDSSFETLRSQGSFSLASYMDEVERSVLEAFLPHCRNTYELGELLKVNQSTVVRKLKKYGISAGR
ncbi:MAG: sigma 54-interacting transcriptional regulator [Lachnospiraceae bacterium]|nr:sigma 54-interacting transcriptional regulator [Lachnospiraceae bacterium]